jgi:signal transduction histidine kinase
VESMRDVAADVYEQVRNNLSILRAWEKTNITDAISRLARVTAHNADLTVEIDIQGEARWLSPHTCEDIYGIVREALNNIVKHASAQRVRLSLVWSDEFLRISVIDDGVGFDPQHIGVDGHYGLALMRETLDALDGEFTVDSRPANGTELLVTIPLRGEDSRHMLGEMRGHESIPVLDAAF